MKAKAEFKMLKYRRLNAKLIRCEEAELRTSTAVSAMRSKTAKPRGQARHSLF